MEEQMDKVKAWRLQAILETFDAKIKRLRKFDETVFSKIDEEKTLNVEIAGTDDYVNELMEKLYRIQFDIKSTQSRNESNASPSLNHESPARNTTRTINSNSHIDYPSKYYHIKHFLRKTHWNKKVLWHV